MLFAQDKAPQSELELVKVASLNTIEANKEFQKNVQLVQQQRTLAVQILSKLEKTQDKDEHDKLQSQLDALQKKLNDNNPVKNNLIASISDGYHFIKSPEPAIAIMRIKIK